MRAPVCRDATSSRSTLHHKLTVNLWGLEKISHSKRLGKAVSSFVGVLVGLRFAASAVD